MTLAQENTPTGQEAANTGIGEEIKNSPAQGSGLQGFAENPVSGNQMTRPTAPLGVSATQENTENIAQIQTPVNAGIIITAGFVRSTPLFFCYPLCRKNGMENVWEYSYARTPKAPPVFPLPPFYRHTDTQV